MVRWAARKGAPAGSWLARMLGTKPKLIVAVALAHKNARIAWALMAKGGLDQVAGVATLMSCFSRAGKCQR